MVDRNPRKRRRRRRRSRGERVEQAVIEERGAAWGVVRAPDETLADPHWRDRGFFVDVEHEELGRTVTYPGAPYLLSATPWRQRRRAPRLGEHTGAILREDAGLTTVDLLALAGAGVIA